MNSQPPTNTAVDSAWIDNVPPPGGYYWDKIRVKAKQLGSDGCTMVSDIFLDACLEHDIHWRLGTTINGDKISRRQANARFRKVIQSRSKLGLCSPISWVRWLGVSIASPFIRTKAS